MKYTLDYLSETIAEEFGELPFYWEITSQGRALLTVEFTYWSEDSSEIYGDRSTFEATNASDVSLALMDAIEQARAEKSESVASLAKRPPEATGERDE